MCTDMLFVEDGDYVICLPPHEDVSYQSYQQNLSILLKYPNDDSHYQKVVEALQRYIQDYVKGDS